MMPLNMINHSSKVSDQIPAALGTPLRPLPFWAWNGWMDKHEIEAQLRYFSAAGFGGAFIHPRPGLATEFLGDEWFALWRHAVDYGKSLGLECQFYDENTFPSGFAGGHVLAEDPDAALEWLEPRPALDVPEELSLAEWTDPDGSRIALVRERGKRDPWFGGRSYANLLRKGAGEAFWQAHHARHIAACPGGIGRYCFTDEPEAKADNVIGTAGAGWAWSSALEKVLRPVIDLLPGGLAALHQDSDAGDLARCRYWLALSRVFASEFIAPYAARCAGVGWRLTGHFNEHHWPNPSGHGSVLHALRFFQTPGTDLLGFQFERSGWEKNGTYWLNLRQAESAAIQFGDGECLCETAGGMGYELSPGTVQALEGFALAGGVTVLVPHLAYFSMRGVRKYEWPGTFSEFTPWMENYRTHADNIEAALRRIGSGKPRRRILLLSPDVAAWKDAAPSKTELGKARSARMKALGSAFVRRAVALHHAQWDFDLGDELLLAESGLVEGGRLRLGHGSYDIVIVPPETTETLSEVHELLRKFSEAGGAVLVGTGALWRGLPPGSACWETLPPLPHVRAFDDDAALLSALAELADRPFTMESGIGEPPAWRYLARPDGSAMLMLSNPWKSPWTGLLQTRGEAKILQSVGGCALAGPDNAITLAPGGWLLVECSPDPIPAPCFAPAPHKSIKLRIATIEPSGPNIMPLDFPSLEIAGKSFGPAHWVKMDARKWESAGWTGNPWRGAIQYRREVVDFSSLLGTEWTASYEFELGLTNAQIADAGTALVVEIPERFEIRLNGRLLDFSDAPSWRGHDNRIAPAAGLRPGTNMLTVHAAHDGAEMELPSVYLVGRWSCVPAQAGFRLEPARPLSTSADWTKQGMPFYDEWVSCRYALDLDAPADGLSIDLGDVRASAVKLSIDGRLVARPFSPEGILTVAMALARGHHELVIELCGWTKNLMGPHVKGGLALPYAWEFQCEGHPSGDSFRFEPFGCPAEVTCRLETLSENHFPRLLEHQEKRRPMMA